MAISSPIPATASPSPRVESHDPILEEIAKSNTFSCDWQTLRQHLHDALASAPPLFQRLDRTRPLTQYSGPSSSMPPSSPLKHSQQDAPLDSLLLSPSQSTSNVTSVSPQSTPVSQSETSPEIGPQDPALKPSTVGGLVIPPFPPIDPQRKRRPLNSTMHAQPGPSLLGVRPNGGSPHPQLVNALNAARAAAGGVGGTFDDEWDEEVVIGGKKLPDFYEDEAGRKEVERLDKMLEEMEYPPFTIQRLAELLIAPTAQHSSLGKFLRSIEKALLVTTAWEPPSYNYVPPSELAASSQIHLRRSSVSSSSSSYDSDDTIPPGSTTPMFSPIPFLVRPTDDESEPGDIEDKMGGSNGHSHEPGGNGTDAKEDGLMSPLMLGSTADGGLHFDSLRASTPEPNSKDEEDMEIEVDSPVAVRKSENDPRSTPSPPRMRLGNSKSPLSSKPLSPSSPSSTSRTITHTLDQTADIPDPQLSGSESSDPSHQPYLGRVDELDSGPLAASPSNREGGKGEGGNMTPHGMSDRPVPISSTTDLHENGSGNRPIAALPRTSSVGSLGLSRSSTEGDLKSLGERFVSSGKIEGEEEVMNEGGLTNGGENDQDGDIIVDVNKESAGDYDPDINGGDQSDALGRHEDGGKKDVETSDSLTADDLKKQEESTVGGVDQVL